MNLNKKQKRQLDIMRKKLRHVQQQLAGAKRQLDDPAEVERLQREIAETETRIRAIQNG